MHSRVMASLFTSPHSAQRLFFLSLSLSARLGSQLTFIYLFICFPGSLAIIISARHFVRRARAGEREAELVNGGTGIWLEGFLLLGEG